MLQVMKRFLLTLAAVVLGGNINAQKVMPDAPFGWATCTSLEKGGHYDLTGGNPAKTVILQSNGLDMREDIIKSVKDYDVIVFDGSCGDFIVSSSMRFSGLRDKTFLGVNGARLKTQFEVTPELTKLLDDAGVKQMSDQGDGGKLSNGTFVYEEREQHTRQAIIDYTGDQKEIYRNSGIFNMFDCSNIIIRNIAFEGPGPIDVGGADLLTLSRGSEHIWVDHCSFTDGMDGNFDINSKSDFITVSWCTFSYTDKAYDHKASNLIASSERPDQGEDNLNITYAYCVWGNGCEVRMPAVRWGRIHLLNNLYDCAGNYFEAVYACIGAEVKLDANYFSKGVKIFRAEPNALGYEFNGNIFREKFAPENKGTVNIPYAYSVVPASRLPKLLKTAGPVLDLEAPASSVKTTIHMIGDSTMADKDISGLNPERGWGMVFENFFDDEVRVMNYAKNGRSTKTVITEGIWDRVKANLRPGDYLFIEFGHNDQKMKNGSIVAPAWGAFQDNLRMFISTAREKGAIPVLLTPVARRHFYNNVLDEHTHGDYPAAMKAVAEETGTVLIDMETATINWLKEAGDLASRPYFMWVAPGTCPAIPQGREDNTHSTPRGARRNCDIVCDSIRVKIPELAKHLVRYDFVVDPDGRGDFLTVQEAINAVPDYLSAKTSTILIKPGVYNEKVYIPVSKRNLVIKGSGAANTIITFNDYAKKKYPDTDTEMGTFGSSTMYVNGTCITFSDLTIENAAGWGDVVGQAVALTTTGDRLFFYNCRILGHQDTIFTSGYYSADGQAPRSYYSNCFIEGTTDFIFGSGIAMFENCTINSLKNSYITAASTDKGQKYGYVFNHCTFTSDVTVDKVFLGRPWRDYAKVVYLNCELGKHICPEGWHNWSQPNREKTAFYAEYRNTGDGADVSGRVAWSHQLTDAEAADYSFEKVIGNFDVWNPFSNWTYGK